MYYIEENFKNHETHLTDEEIDVLKEFIEDINNNLLVEGVYITPFYCANELDSIKINIKIII